MERDSLILYAKIESLFFQVYPAFKNFPKSEKHGLCRHLKECFVRLLESVGKAQAGDILACIRAFGRDVIRLTFPDRKCFIRPLGKDGLESLGYRITPTRIGLTSAARSRFIKRVAGFDRLLQAFRISPREVKQSLTSWYSYASLASCQSFVERACLRTQCIRFSDNKFHVRQL